MPRKYKIAPAVCLAAWALDQITKTIAREELFPNRTHTVFRHFLEFKYAENPGMAFGFFNNISDNLRLPLFTAVTIVAVAIILHLLRQAPERAARLPLALGFILSGAFGNLTDRFRFDGIVVDFIRVKLGWPVHFRWPTFNLADTFITIGIFLLIIDMFLTPEAKTPAASSLSQPTDEGPPAGAGAPSAGLADTRPPVDADEPPGAQAS